MKNTFLAADFGGGSGRVMAGYIVDGRLQIEEIYRFANRQVRIGNHVYWDFPSLFADMKEGIRRAAQRPDLRICSIGVDTWGVDFALIDDHDNLVSLPVCYRDSRTEGLCEAFMQAHDADAHYAEAGVQMMDINTIYQLQAMLREQPKLVEAAKSFLFMPDLFSFYLCGRACCEYTIASTSELLDARSRGWNIPLIQRLGLRPEMFPPIVMPGEKRGRILPEVAAELSLPDDVKVIAVGSHDTQSASFAAPIPVSEASTTAFLSSGTWSLLGVDLPHPILTPEARRAGLSNEGSVNGGVNLLQNITGLWILQRLMAEWEKRGTDCRFEHLLPLAEESETAAVIDVDDPLFANPASMEKAIADWCTAHGITPPQGEGETVYCVLNSLARRYARGIADMNRLLPEPIRRLCIIGGGSRNGLLNRLTAQHAGIEVTTGPVEATAIGNILVQAIAMGEIAGKDEVKF